MELKLNSVGVSAYSEKVLYLTDDDYIVRDVKLPKIQGKFYFIGEVGEYRFKKEITAGTLIFAKGQLRPGEIKGTVVHMYKGTKIREYVVEPLIVAELETPEIYSAVEEKVNELDERVKTLEQKKIIK